MGSLRVSGAVHDGMDERDLRRSVLVEFPLETDDLVGRLGTLTKAETRGPLTSGRDSYAGADDGAACTIQSSGSSRGRCTRSPCQYRPAPVKEDGWA